MSKTLIVTALLIMFLSAGAISYRTYVDTDYGFYKVSILSSSGNISTPIDFSDKTLTINVGDTVEWFNDADPDEKITLIDDEGEHVLRWNYQKYSRTFQNSGTYTVNIKEYPRLITQTIIVQSVNVVTTMTTTQTPIQTTQPTTTQIPTTTTEPEQTIPLTTETPKTKSTSNIGILTLIVCLFIFHYLTKK